MQKSAFVPLLDQKGQMVSEVTGGVQGICLNNAYALGSNVSVLCNGFGSYRNTASYSHAYNGETETGIGYYHLLRDSTHYEAFITASVGWVGALYERPSDQIRQYLDNNLFSQRSGPSPQTIAAGSQLGMKGTGRYYTFAMQHSLELARLTGGQNATVATIRMQYLKFNPFLERADINTDFVFSLNDYSKYFFQFVLTDKLSLTKHWSAQLQLGVNFDLTPNSIDVFGFDAIYAYAGLQYAFKPRITVHGRSYRPPKSRKNIFQKGY